VWKNGEFVTKWKIHKLDTAGYPNLTGWQAWGVNDYGQIVGIAFDNEFTRAVSPLWNPRQDGKGWQLTMLPPSSDYPYTFAFRINNMGYIAGAFESGDGSLWLPRFWKPLDLNRTTYSQAIELPVPKGYIGCEAVGINELGDVTGDCYNRKVDVAARWTMKDLSFSEILGFPGSLSFAWGVSNNRIAAVFYVGSKACPADTYGSCGGAIELH